MAPVCSAPQQNDPPTCICLIGAGTVGRAILEVHLQHHFDVVLVDARQDALIAACNLVSSAYPSHRIEATEPVVAQMPAAKFTTGQSTSPGLVIESIPEHLLMKHALFFELGQRLGPDVIFASNTSNLRIADVFKPMGNDPRCCGLHFFMPVGDRPLVECVPTPTTSPQTLAICQAHALRIDKQTLFVQDSPGFVVNRLLAPYLNQSLLLLEHGVDASHLARAAGSFGMPMSPLKLIDLIGLRTAFDSGRVFWQSFPERLDPASLLPGMLKARRKSGGETSGGETSGGETSGFLESDALSRTARQVVAFYRRNQERHWSLDEVTELIAIPMWIEAAELLATGVVSDRASIELAMSGGLGYVSPLGFFGFFDALGRDVVLRHLQSSSGAFRALRAPAGLVAYLEAGLQPQEAVIRYAEHRQATRQ